MPMESPKPTDAPRPVEMQRPAPLRPVGDAAPEAEAPPSLLERITDPPDVVKLTLGALSGVFILGAILHAAITGPPTPKAPPKPTPTIVAAPPPPAPPAGPASTAVAPPPAENEAVKPFEDYVKKRQEIERLIVKNPLVLREEGILPLYDKLHVETQKAEAAAKKKTKKRPKVIEDRVRDIEVFERTQGLVDALYEKLAP